MKIRMVISLFLVVCVSVCMGQDGHKMPKKLKATSALAKLFKSAHNGSLPFVVADRSKRPDNDAVQIWKNEGPGNNELQLGVPLLMVSPKLEVEFFNANGQQTHKPEFYLVYSSNHQEGVVGPSWKQLPAGTTKLVCTFMVKKVKKTYIALMKDAHQ